MTFSRLLAVERRKNSYHHKLNFVATNKSHKSFLLIDKCEMKLLWRDTLRSCYRFQKWSLPQKKVEKTIKPKEKQQTPQNMPSIKRELSASQENINNSSLRQFCILSLPFTAIYLLLILCLFAAETLIKFL